MDLHARALEIARSFVKEIGAAHLSDVPALREKLARQATPEATDLVTRELAALGPDAPALLRSLPPEAVRALSLLGELVEQADAMSDAELLAGLRAFADMYTPLVFDPPA